MYQGSLGTVSNREDWIQAVDVVDENGDDVTITSASIELAVRRNRDCAPSLEASVGDGIVIASPRFTFTFTEGQMDDLAPGSYDVGVRIRLNGETNWSQLLVGTVTIVDGVVD